MKHVFVIHSQITFLVSVLSVRYLKLESANCIFLLFRNFTPSVDVGIKIDDSWKFTYGKKQKYHQYSFRKTRDVIAQIDRWVTTEIGKGKFSVYAPDHSKKAIEILYTHKNCISLNAIEDGYGSYDTYTQISGRWLRKMNWIQKLQNTIKSSNRLVFSGFVFRKNKDVFCLNDGAFIGAPSKHLVLDSAFLHNLSFQDSCTPQLPVSSGVLVFDGLEEFGYAQKDEFEKVTLELVALMLDRFEIKVCYLKFHPMQEKERIEYYEQLIKKSFSHADIRILGNEICLELLAIKNPSTQFFGFISSALLYAKLLADCKAYTIINRLNTKHVHVSEFYKQNVTLIDNYDSRNTPL